MPLDFNALRKLYDNGQFVELLRNPDGVYWLKLRSISRTEDIFKDHPSVLPVTGLVKKVDFFIHDFPFDLKVTYFPDGYMGVLRKAEGLRPELTELKAFCKREGIYFETDKPAGVLFSELLAKVSEYPSTAAREFIAAFKATRARLIRQTIKNPTALKIWLYENQGLRRFDASSRFFLILVDLENLDESWKLKRNKKVLVNAINSHLDTMTAMAMRNLRLKFTWKDETYETYADMLFVMADKKR